MLFLAMRVAGCRGLAALAKIPLDTVLLSLQHTNESLGQEVID